MGTQKMLTLDQILHAKDIREETIEVAEWGGTVRIRSFTKEQGNRLQSEATVDDKIDRERMEMLYLVEGVIEPQITREHIGLLRQRSARAVGRVMDAILKINGIREEDVEAAKKTFPDRSGSQV